MVGSCKVGANLWTEYKRFMAHPLRPNHRVLFGTQTTGCTVCMKGQAGKILVIFMPLCHRGRLLTEAV